MPLQVGRSDGPDLPTEPWSAVLRGNHVRVEERTGAGDEAGGDQTGLGTEGAPGFGPLSSLTFPGSGIRRGRGLGPSRCLGRFSPGTQGCSWKSGGGKLSPSSAQQVRGRAPGPERGAWTVLRPLLGIWWIIRDRESTAQRLSSEVLPCLASDKQRRPSGGMFLGLQGCLLLPAFPDILLHPWNLSQGPTVNHWAGRRGFLPPSARAELWAGAPLLSAVDPEQYCLPPDLGCHSNF